jgi:hypothetical protein
VNPESDAEAFAIVWASLNKSIQQAIRGTAILEHMTLKATMEHYWPSLWQRVQKEMDDHTQAENQT